MVHREVEGEALDLEPVGQAVDSCRSTEVARGEAVTTHGGEQLESHPGAAVPGVAAVRLGGTGDEVVDVAQTAHGVDEARVVGGAGLEGAPG